LKNHQKTASFCLKLQSKEHDVIKVFNCKGCKKKFSREDNYKKHSTNCKHLAIEKLNSKIKTQKKEYEYKLSNQKEEYEDKLSNQKEEYEDKLSNQKEEYENKIKDLMDRLENFA